MYMSGFGNHFATEAIANALPRGQNSPQRAPHGLYTEQLSGTAFTAPRAHNLRAWLYRLRPSAAHPPYVPYDGGVWPHTLAAPIPNRLRWSPLPAGEGDFINGLFTYAGNGDPAQQAGIAIHGYAAGRSMRRVFFNADAEMMIVPQQGGLDIFTEMGRIGVSPLSIAVIPRGVRFRVAVTGDARGYCLENFGAPFRLPELGPIGANGLANPRDFETPAAAFEDDDAPCEMLQKFSGRLWRTQLPYSPLDVVAWHGNYAPYRYDLRRFNTINTVSFDHLDPSIFTVLTSPSDTPGVANCDFVIFPPRWMVAEHSFRPPWFHRNIMSEFMGLIEGVYDAKADGFAPGGASLHNMMSAHGPDKAAYDTAVTAELKPYRIDNAMAFMWETRHLLRPSQAALDSDLRQQDYDACWSGFEKAKLP